MSKGVLGRLRRGLGLGLGFVVGWWLLQTALLGAGLIAVDRVQTQLAAERLAALGEVLQTALGQGGSKLPQDRFGPQAEAVLAADSSLALVQLLDRKGAVREQAGRLAPAAERPNGALAVPVSGGTLVLVADPPPPPWHGGGLRLILAAALMPLFYLPLPWWLSRRQGSGDQDGKRRRLLWMGLNGLPGMVTSVLLMAALLATASSNAAIKGAVLDASLAASVRGQLVQPVLDLRFLNRQLAAYQALDPRVQRMDLSFTLGGDAASEPRWWEQTRRVRLDGERALAVVRSWPPVEATPALMRGLRNVVVLVVATALLCAAFGGAGARRAFAPPLAAFAPARGGPAEGEAVLEAIRPLYFLAVFAENLCAPFLPRLLHDAVAQAALPPAMASALFMAYFLAFTAVLLPAGWLSARFGAGGLVKAGAALLALGLVLPALWLNAPALAAARILSGAGQGVLLIGVQSLILAHASAAKRSAGTSIIVFGFNGGMVGGSAFGSLLVDRFGASAVFAVAGGAAALVAVAALAVLAGVRAKDDPRPAAASGRGLDLGGLRCLMDGRFLGTTLLIGIPTKAVLTGVVLFALPLILGQRGFSLEEIGQTAMLYAAGVLTVTSGASHLADRWRRTGTLLTVGALFSAIGMAAIWASSLPALTDNGVGGGMLLACIFMLGMAHGCINAPVVAHVASLPVAQRHGAIRTAATYRLVERVGHMAGPLVVERCLAAAGGQSIALAWIAAAVAAAGLVFMMQNARPASV